MVAYWLRYLLFSFCFCFCFCCDVGFPLLFLYVHPVSRYETKRKKHHSTFDCAEFNNKINIPRDGWLRVHASTSCIYEFIGPTSGPIHAHMHLCIYICVQCCTPECCLGCMLHVACVCLWGMCVFCFFVFFSFFFFVVRCVCDIVSFFEVWLVPIANYPFCVFSGISY